MKNGGFPLELEIALSWNEYNSRNCKTLGSYPKDNFRVPLLSLQDLLNPTQDDVKLTKGVLYKTFKPGITPSQPSTLEIPH